MKDSSKANSASAPLRPPVPPTALKRKISEAAEPDPVTARVQKVADGMAKTFRENPDWEVPY